MKSDAHAGVSAAAVHDRRSKRTLRADGGHRPPLRVAQRGLLIVAAVAAVLGGICGAFAADDLAARTIVLVNSRQPDSVELGKFYAEQRAIPPANIIALPMPLEEGITWRVFVDEVWQPLQNELHRRKWIEGALSEQLDPLGRRKSAFTGHRMAYLVLCRGTPLRIFGDPTQMDPAVVARLPEQFRHDQAAVDSELSLLAQAPQPTLGLLPNPLFRVKQVSTISSDLVVKVARLDGPSEAAARGLVRSALAAERHGLIGRYYVDLVGPHASGDRWLEAARAKLSDLGYFGDVERTGALFGVGDRFDAAAFYFGWYSSGVTGVFQREGFRFAPGAIALHIHSYSAATLRESGGAWTGALIARGAAATFGNVFEPYLEFTIRPDLLLEQLAAGATLGDAAYYATPVLSWQGVIVGDPLYRPFKVSLPEQISQLNEMPASLAGHAIARQAAVLDRLGMIDEARALLVRGMREQPSLALALAQARFELTQQNPVGAVASLAFVPSLPQISLEDWPLVRAAGEFVAANGSARDALPIYQRLLKAKAPGVEVQISVVNAARKLADATGNLALSLEFAKQAADLAPPPPPPTSGSK